MYFVGFFSPFLVLRFVMAEDMFNMWGFKKPARFDFGRCCSGRYWVGFPSLSLSSCLQNYHQRQKHLMASAAGRQDPEMLELTGDLAMESEDIEGLEVGLLREAPHVYSML